MKKIYCQRKVEVWIEETYTVEEFNDNTIDSIINYDIDADDIEVLWESQEDLGPVEFYDDKRNLLYSNTTLDNE